MTSFTTATRILKGFPFLCKLRHLNLSGITKFKYEKKSEKDSGRSSKMTPSCKWPFISFSGYKLPSSFNHKSPSEFYLLLIVSSGK